MVPNCPGVKLSIFSTLGAKLSGAKLSYNLKTYLCNKVEHGEKFTGNKSGRPRPVRALNIWKWKRRNKKNIRHKAFRGKKAICDRDFEKKDSWSSSSFFATWAWMINSCQGGENVPWFWYFSIYDYFLWQEHAVWFRSSDLHICMIKTNWL